MINLFVFKSLFNKSSDDSKSSSSHIRPANARIGFTIVELLIVIIIIGILASIIAVSYVGVSRTATAETLKQDLNDGASHLKKYYYDNGAYPATLDGSNCPTGSGDTSYCLKPSSGNTYVYTSTDPYQTFTLDATNTASNVTYRITNNSSPVLVST